MKIARVAGWVLVIGSFAACARAPEAAAPAAGSSGVEPTPVASAVGESAAKAEPASPEAPPAPQGLDGDQQRKPKASALDDTFKTLQEAERALDQAKSDLDRLALAQPAPSVGRSGAADRASEKKDSKGGEPAAPAGAAAPNGLCENACRAFSSLSRAASAVCRLDSSSGNSHCLRARRVVVGSQQRVASCSCPANKD